MPLSIEPFSDDLAPEFHRINREWIEAMFTLEANDLELLRNPRSAILDRGGDVLFVRASEAGIVGTCALLQVGPGVFELTKMGVTAEARGKKAGEFLLRAALERSLTLGARSLYLLTSSKCEAAIHLYEKVGFVHDAEVLAEFGPRYERCDVAMSFPISVDGAGE